MDALLTSVLTESFTLGEILIVSGSSLILGFLISLVYVFTHKKTGYAPSFAITLVMLPIIIAVIIMLIGNNVARAFSLAGAFTIIRFRSAPADSKDIAYIFMTLAVGLALGLGFIGYAAIFAVIILIVLIILEMTGFGVPKCEHFILKVTVPEDLNYQELFTDILKEYASSYRMKRVRTADFGALFEVAYYVELKKGVNQKEMIDKIRTRNGNLNVSLLFREYEDKLYEPGQ